MKHFKIHIFFVIVLSGIIFSACDLLNLFEPTTDPDPEPIMKLTIGTKGGELETDDLILTVPEGTFASDASIEYYELSENVFPNSITKHIKLSGIPKNFREPIQVKLKYNGALSGEAIIGVGQVTTLSNVDTSLTDVVYNYVLAEAKDGFLTCQLQPSDSVFLKSQGDDFEIFLQGSSDGSVYNSSNGHFKLTTVYLEPSLCYEILNLLEQEITKMEECGLDLTRYPAWPILLEDSKHTGAKNYLFKDEKKNNSFKIGNTYDKKNEEILDDAEKFVSVLNFWFYLSSGLYTINENDIYFPTVVSFWAASHFVKDWDRIEVVKQSFKIDETPPLMTFIMISYLLDTYGMSKLGEVFEQIDNGMRATDAINYKIEDSSVWLSDFYESIMTSNELRSALGTFWEENKSDQTSVRAGFNSDEFENSYPQMSGRWYRIDLDSSLPEKSKLKLSVEMNGYDYPEISVFKFSGTTIQFIDNDYHEVTVSGLKQLADDYYGLYALVVNSLAIPPYAEVAPITLQVELQEPSETTVTNCRIILQDVEVTIREYYSTGSSDYNDHIQEMSFDFKDLPGEAVFENSEFSKTFDYTTTTGARRHGAMVVTFNDDMTEILEFSAYSKTIPDDEAKNISEESISGNNIPLNWGDYKVVGTETCDLMAITKTVTDQSGELQSEIMETRCISQTGNPSYTRLVIYVERE